MNDNNCLVTERPQTLTGRSWLFFEEVLVYWLWHRKTTGKNDLVENNDGGKKDPFSWLKFIGE